MEAPVSHQSPERLFQTIVADPPWKQKAGPLAGGVGEGFAFDGKQISRDLPYPTMSLDAIKALPVGELAAPNAHLYLRATNKYLPDAFEVVRAWGFTYSTTLAWAKNLTGGGLGGAYRVSTEFVIFAARGSLREVGTVRGTWFNWKRPYNEQGKPKHSAKPPEFFEMVESVSPGPRLELFARIAEQAGLAGATRSIVTLRSARRSAEITNPTNARGPASRACG